MALLPFPDRPRAPEPTRSIAGLDAASRSMNPLADVTVRKADRVRRYVITGGGEGRWIGEVWFDRARHRRRVVAGVHDVRALAAQFLRELRDLLADGWT